jgi:hypothetical protein
MTEDLDLLPEEELMIRMADATRLKVDLDLPGTGPVDLDSFDAESASSIGDDGPGLDRHGGCSSIRTTAFYGRTGGLTTFLPRGRKRRTPLR